MLILIGNKLSSSGLNATSIEKLAIDLDSRYRIESASDKKNNIFRIIDIISLIIINRKVCKLIVVDVYSTRAFYFSGVVMLLARIVNIFAIPVFRGGSLPERFESSPALFNLFFKKNQFIICPSSFLADYFRTKKLNCKILHNYIEIKNYPYKIRNKIKPRLLWVRSIHAIYNPLMAIKVLNEVLKFSSNAELCMVGPSKDNTINQIKELIIKFNLGDKVQIQGKLEKKEWIELSKDYDIFLNTTNIDNQPVSIIEAMALGLPIISTNAGGIPNMLIHNKTAKLVEINDVNGMVDCIKEYLSDNIGRMEIVKNARELVESEFNQDKVIPQWVDIIEKYTLPSNLSK